MDALHFIVRTVLQLLLVTVFLLRFLLPLVRADVRNPVSQAVLRITNPIVLPLARFVPSARRIDLPALVALLLVQLATTMTLLLLRGFGLVNPTTLLLLAVTELTLATLQFYFFAILIYVLLSWVAPGTYSPAASLLASLCEPILRPVRRVVPPIGGLDLSPLVVMIGLQALQILIT